MWTIYLLWKQLENRIFQNDEDKKNCEENCIPGVVRFSRMWLI